MACRTRAPSVVSMPTIAMAHVREDGLADVRADLDEPLSRWLWIVKPLLVVPHAIVLAFLWIGFVAATLAALVAVLATGRYPEQLHAYNVGVLRWTWRVAFYSTGALGTDRYPPFTLGEADYPADVEIGRPETTDRRSAAFRLLLGLPHLVIVCTLTGTGIALVLVLVAGVLLAVKGTYPQDVFRLLVGIARWTIRTAAYVAFLRDEYPPFRLDT